MGAIKITPADAAFSKCVRERAGWKCERCGSQHDTSSTGLHCSHFHGRSKWGVRFDPINGTALCHGCHRYLAAHPHMHEQYQIERLGEVAFAILNEMANDTQRGKEYKRTKGVGAVARHYRQEYARMQETGSKVFAGWI